MYDQVFVPEKKEFQNTRAVKSKIISDKAKANAKDGKMSASVSITFHNLEKDSNDLYSKEAVNKQKKKLLIEKKKSIIIRTQYSLNSQQKTRPSAG
jgi:hypothetical protein